MASNITDPRFEIAAAVVFRLGEELITDVVQALVELVKNSYDADASWARVTITTPKNASSGAPETIGEIVVEDDGNGMDADDFQRGWLMIADSAKKSMKDSGKTTRKKRTPVGDKGLGRLGVQRLGHDVEIVSRIRDPAAEELRLVFSWRDFLEARRLSDVPVQLEAQSRSWKRSGTKIVVRDLKNPDQWVGKHARTKLQRSLSELISPFQEVRDFNVTVTLNGEKVEIAEIAEQLRETASVRYKLTFNGSVLRVDGKVRLNFVERAQKKEDQAYLQGLLSKDKGRAFVDYLERKEARKRPPNLQFHENSKWFVTFHFEQELDPLGDVLLADGSVASPGPFRGEIDYLLLDNEDISGHHVWDKLSDYRHLVSGLAGIRVYRDCFGVRVGDDWLNLGHQSTSGSSIYGLRPKNVIGFVAISARDNDVLLETTSREGFQDTPHYRNFYRLLQNFVSWSEQAQGYLRRGALSFLKDSRAQSVGLELGGETTSATEKLREKALSIDRREQDLDKAKDSLKQHADSVQSRAEEITAGDEQLALYNQDKLEKISSFVKEYVSVSDELQQMLEHQPEASATAQQILDVLSERGERLQREAEDLYGGVALGLTAEVLSHEIADIADRLAKKAANLGTYLTNKGSKDAKILGFVSYVKSSVAALRKQLAHLAPSLRYVRENRETVVVASELEENRDFYKSRFASHAITMLVRDVAGFQILINRGKLSQIFSNILLNSEYWLRESRRKDPTFDGKISVEMDRPSLRFWDNGPGVDLSIEDNLFDPFTTTKEQGKGRGLGMFIVQQLLDAEGCSIRLLPERNEMGHRFKFEINFQGALK
jgi:signal transduction histidine kinase/TolB-like protein